MPRTVSSVAFASRRTVRFTCLVGSLEASGPSTLVRNDPPLLVKSDPPLRCAGEPSNATALDHIAGTRTLTPRHDGRAVRVRSGCPGTTAQLSRNYSENRRDVWREFRAGRDRRCTLGRCFRRGAHQLVDVLNGHRRLGRAAFRLEEGGHFSRAEAGQFWRAATLRPGGPGGGYSNSNTKNEPRMVPASFDFGARAGRVLGSSATVSASWVRRPRGKCAAPPPVELRRVEPRCRSGRSCAAHRRAPRRPVTVAVSV